jgi:N-acetylmuramoyl-L-alanine amidase
VRSPQFVGRPARPERIQGLIQGQVFEQFDYTTEQYDTLTKLAAVLCKVLPRIAPDAPRDAQGRVRTDALDAAEFADFSGILGHNHVTIEKNDPGPAMDWERLLEAVRARL